jgi:hypothetical protein
MVNLRNVAAHAEMNLVDSDRAFLSNPIKQVVDFLHLDHGVLQVFLVRRAVPVLIILVSPLQLFRLPSRAEPPLLPHLV